MKFQISLETLSNAINWVNKGIPQRPSMPVLGGIHIVSDKEIEFSAFDYEISTLSKVKADVLEPGEALVSGKILSDIVRSLPNETINFSTNDSELEINCGKINFSLPLMPLEDYPKFPIFPEKIGSIKSTQLAQGILEVAISASKEDSLPMLTGIKCEFTKDNISLISTDKHRLSFKDLSWNSENNNDYELLVPFKNLTEFAKIIITEPETEVQIAFNSNSENSRETILGLKSGNKELTTRVLDLDYPPVRKLLRPEHKTIISVKNSDFISAIRRASLMSERGVQVILEIQNSGMKVRAGSGNGKAAEILEVQKIGEDISIAFSPAYLLEGLSSFKSEKTMIGLEDSKKVALLVPDDGKISEITGNEEVYNLPQTNLIYLLMPIRMN